MLKGDVFSEQYFAVETFAAFVNMFTGNTNGIINNYQDGMEITFEGNNVSISKGAACIFGRFVREDSITTLSVEAQTKTYCSLVIEVNLDKINTRETFNQGAYKVITSSIDYPALTQNDLTNQDGGIYQFELARFIVEGNKITELTDRRKKIDFESIYAEIQAHIDAIDDGSLFATKQELNTFKTQFSAEIDNEMTELQTNVNTSITNMEKAVNEAIAGTIKSSSFKVTRATYSNANPNQCYNSTRDYDEYATATTSGDYYPIAYLGVQSNNSEIYFGYLDNAAKNSCRVHWLYKNSTGASINAWEMPSAIISVLWVKM